MRASLLIPLLLGLGGPTLARATCVATQNYPTQLRLPHLEHWASDAVFGNATPETECHLVNTLRQLSPLRPGRGTHAKGTCVAGTFHPHFDVRLSEERRALLRRAEVFATTNDRAVHARYANGSPKIQPDWVKDIRTLSLKVALDGGRHQDFSFNNATRFQISSLHNLNLFFEMSNAVLAGEIELAGAWPSLRSVFAYFQRKSGTLAAGRDLYHLNRVLKLIKQDYGWHDSYLTQTYVSSSPFALGDTNRDVNELARVVKFGAWPCNEKSTVITSEDEAKNASRMKGIERPNYLGDDLHASVARTPACFRVFVEFLDQEKSVTEFQSASDFIEDTSLIWRAPTYAVGEITLDRVVDQKTCDDAEHGINVLHNQSGLVGVGQINRAREFIDASAPR